MKNEELKNMKIEIVKGSNKLKEQEEGIINKQPAVIRKRLKNR